MRGEVARDEEEEEEGDGDEDGGICGFEEEKAEGKEWTAPSVSSPILFGVAMRDTDVSEEERTLEEESSGPAVGNTVVDAVEVADEIVGEDVAAESFIALKRNISGRCSASSRVEEAGLNDAVERERGCLANVDCAVVAASDSNDAAISSADCIDDASVVAVSFDSDVVDANDVDAGNDDAAGVDNEFDAAASLRA